jgi:peroxiredoxin Q/BCP
MSTPKAGDPAPDFALPDDRGDIHRLSDQRGRWTVVYFYPADDTPGCTTEACQFRDAEQAIADRGAVVWGISPDTVESHARFRDKYGLPFTLLSDVDHAVADRYGAWQLKQSHGREYWGVMRSTFLVDPEGRIARTWPQVTADGHAAAVLVVLQEVGAAR